MATISGAGGTTTSLSNTPQAGDDCYSFTEDQLLGDSTLYSVANDTIYLNVMANDLGGKAKSLFSISDVDGTPIDDLTSTDLLSNSKNSCWEQTTQGNWIRIYNGKIEYRLDGRNVDSLGVGDTIADSFVYAIKLGNGTLSWATVHVNLAGSNDALVITPGGDYSGGVTETSGTPTDSAPDLTDSGSFSYSDVDTSDIATVGAALKSVNGVIDSAALALGDFSASISGDTAATNGGTVTWTYAVDPDLLESMAQGETLVLVYTVTVDDGHGSTQAREVTITVTGTNDGPEITSAAQSGTVVEDTALIASGQVTADDVDNGAVLSYTGDATGTYGSFVVTAATGEWTYTLDNAAHQALAEGEEHTETFTVTVTDEFGASTTQDVTITVKGTNDGPEIDDGASTVSGSLIENSAAAPATQDALVQGQIAFNDIDNGDTPAASCVSAAATLVFTPLGGLPTALPPGFLESNIKGAFGIDPDGLWAYDGSAVDVEALGLGDTIELTYDITVTDGSGATDTTQVTVTITGTNDAPVITGGDFAGSLGEDDSTTSEPPSVSGTIFADDIDNGAVLTFSGNANGTYGSFAVTAGGTWTYTLNNSLALTQALAEGESHVEIFTVTVTDEHGLTSFEEVEVTVNGDNDAPEITSAAQSGAVQEDDVLTATGQIAAFDIDNDAVLTYSGNATSTYGSFTVNAFTGEWTYTLDNANHQDLTAGSSITEVFTVTVSDGLGGIATQDVTITVTGKDEPVVVTTRLAAFAGTGDSNDFDDAGPTAGATVTNVSNGGQNQTYNGTNGNDTIAAGNGDDTVYGHDGNDTILGENQADTSLYGQRGDDTLSGGQAGDEIFGGSGNDTIYGQSAATDSGDLGDGLYGGSGADFIHGQVGDDLITGGFGADELWGHGGADRFVFIDERDRGDIIRDFSNAQGDILDLSVIDADTSDAAHDSLVWGGTTATANGLWYQYDLANNVTRVYGDTDGNVATAEIWFDLSDNVDLAAAQAAGNIVL